MKKIYLCGLATIMSVFAQHVVAASGFYVLGEVGQAQTAYPQTTADNTARAMGVNTLNSSATGQPTSWKATLGYQLDDHFAVEASYIDVGKISYHATGMLGAFPVSGSEVVSAKLWNWSGVAKYDLTESFSLMGKLGVASFKSSSQPGGTLAPAFAAMKLAGSKTDVSYGIGAGYQLTPSLALRMDWDRISTGISAQKQLSIYSAGLAFNF